MGIPGFENLLYYDNIYYEGKINFALQDIRTGGKEQMQSDDDDFIDDDDEGDDSEEDDEEDDDENDDREYSGEGSDDDF